MPVKPVTHNKYSDMKRYTWIWIMLIALLSGCEDDFDKGGSNTYDALIVSTVNTSY